MINIKLPHLTNKDGFTLIELVVAFSIMAVLSTIGIASFVNYSRAQTLQQATNGLITTLNTAKAKSLVQVKPDACIGTLGGYSVILTKANNSYKLQAICSGGSVDIPPPTPLPPGVSFSSSMLSTTTITFSVLTGAVVSGNIILDGSQLGLPSKTITIDSGGNIKISTWTFCANEGDQCSFTGTKEVRYGANGSYSSIIFTNGTPCTNAVFGDPLYGTVKQCYYQDTNP